MNTAAAWILGGILLGASPSAEDAALEEVLQCQRKNFSVKTSEETIEFTQIDRVGGERTTRAKLYAKKGEDGLRKLLLRFSRPPDLRGSAYLLLENESGRNDMFLYSPDMGRTRRVTTHMAAGSLFGTDFSYEDFERLQGLADNTKNERRPDAVVGDRPVPTPPHCFITGRSSSAAGCTVRAC